MFSLFKQKSAKTPKLDKITTCIEYGRRSGKVALNSFSTFISNSSKGDAVRNAYAKKYFNTPEAFLNNLSKFGSAGPEEYPKKGKPDPETFNIAYQLGKLVAENKAILITGGKGGIMESAAKGAKEAGGTTVGVVQGNQRFTSNSYTDVEVVSGMTATGEETILILMCDGLIGVGGGAGTLQELSIAYRNQKPVVLVSSQSGWSKTLAGKYLDSRKKIKFKSAKTPEKAVKILFRLIKQS